MEGGRRAFPKGSRRRATGTLAVQTGSEWAPAKVRREAPEACFSAHLYPVLSNDLPPQFSPRARPKDSRLFFHQMGGGHFNRTTTGDFDGPRMAQIKRQEGAFPKWLHPPHDGHPEPPRPRFSRRQIFWVCRSGFASSCVTQIG